MTSLTKEKSLLNKIQETLKSLNLLVYYGLSTHDENLDWNYFVFRRKSLGKAGTSRHDFRYSYLIYIIMENYIEEGFDTKVINAIEKNTKLKLADTEHTYDYIVKKNTDQVCEVLTLEFTKFVKGCAINE